MRRLLPLLMVAMLGCGSDEPESTTSRGDELDENECGVLDKTPEAYVVRKLVFTGANAGVSQGLDLDGRVSDRSDDLSCNQIDFVDPDGNEGIDNQFALLVPALDAVTGGGESVDALIQRTINSGNVLLTIETQRNESWDSDPCVEVTVARATGSPLVGADGFLEIGQTLDRDLDAPSAYVAEATITDGALLAGPIDLNLPLTVDAFDLVLTIRNAYIRVEKVEDGLVRGIISGGVVVEEIVEQISEIGASSEVLDVAATVMKNSADLNPNDAGVCQDLSATFEIEASSVFFFPIEAQNESSTSSIE